MIPHRLFLSYFSSNWWSIAHENTHQICSSSHIQLLYNADNLRSIFSNLQKFTVPQKYFMHFYVVGVLATTILLLAIWFYAYMKMTPLLPESSSYSTIASHLVGSNSFSFGRVHSRTMGHKYHVWRTVFVLLLMEIQVLRRLYETEHVFHYSPSARMHIVGYLTGLL